MFALVIRRFFEVKDLSLLSLMLAFNDCRKGDVIDQSLLSKMRICRWEKWKMLNRLKETYETFGEKPLAQKTGSVSKRKTARQ